MIHSRITYLLSPGERQPLLATGGKSSSRRRVRKLRRSNHSRTHGSQTHLEDHHSRGSSVAGTELRETTRHRICLLARSSFPSPPASPNHSLARRNVEFVEPATSTKSPRSCRADVGLTTDTRHEIHRPGGSRQTSRRTVLPLFRDGRERSNSNRRARRVFRKLSLPRLPPKLFSLLLRFLSYLPHARRSRRVGDRRRLIGERYRSPRAPTKAEQARTEDFKHC